MNAGIQSLGLLGGTMMAAGAPSTDPGQYGRIMAQGLAQAGPMMQQSLDQQMQMEEYQKQQEREAALQEYLASGGGGLLSPEQASFLGMVPPEVGASILGEQMFPGANDPVTLGTGEILVDANGELIAEGPESVLTPTSAQNNALALGLVPGTPEYNAYLRDVTMPRGTTPTYEEDLNGVLRWVDGPNAGEPVFPTVPPPEPDPLEGFDDEKKLRDEYTKFSADYIDVTQALRKVEQAGVAGTPAGDISLVFAYMKMIDPGSTVREGEAATVRNARGVPEGVMNLYNQLVNGLTLTPEQRQDFTSQAMGMYEGYAQSYQQLTDNYNKLAESYGLDPSKVTIDFSYTPNQGTPSPDSGQSDPPPTRPDGTFTGTFTSEGYPIYVRPDGTSFSVNNDG